jgi:NADH-quinone oxidoreductase subunit D
MSTLKSYVLGEDTPDEVDLELPTEFMKVNMGPSHPAMHGTVRIVLTLDGERIVDADVQPGFLHRAFEKECEYATYTQIFPYTDRMNYVSPMLNNIGYAYAVEKMLGIEKDIPERAQYIRVIVGEAARVVDHLTCIAASAMELGAYTPFLYWMKIREWFYQLFEELCGARITNSYVRIGGVACDLTDDFAERMAEVLRLTEKTEDECEILLTENKIFYDRMANVGIISPDDALQWGLTGPILRSCGVDYDVRKDYPYLVYDQLEFDVPVGSTGDCYDRYLVRLEEARQSIRIIRQAMKQIPDGPIMIDDPRVALPDKQETYNTIEGMIRHFKHIVDGITVPPGESYSCTEGANGELGFFIVADGTGRPYKCYARSPSFSNLQSGKRMFLGGLIADVIPVFGQVNMIGGECDK